jgi:Tol biopolymer transport system component
LRQLTDHAQHLPTAVNDKQLLYMFNNNGDWDIYAIDLPDSEPQKLTHQPSADAWGTFSPDGRTIAFLSNRDGRWAIWFMNSDGSNAWEWLPLDPAWGEIDFNRIGEERMSWSR